MHDIETIDHRIDIVTNQYAEAAAKLSGVANDIKALAGRIDRVQRIADAANTPVTTRIQ